MLLYADLFSGVSGDMLLGALIDLGVPEDWLSSRLKKVVTGFNLKTQTVFRHHIRAMDLAVEITEKQPDHRHYSDIKVLIEQSGLSDFVKEKSLETFHRIAAAESKIHGKDIETVHFHEVGAIDSLVDIIGTFLAVEYLGIKKVYASEIPLGSGFIECAHGTIPVPVPATIAILSDTPVTPSDAKTEIVTPTGAALIKTLCKDFGPMPGMVVRKTGYGAGKRDTGSRTPNLLRLTLGSPEIEETFNPSHIYEETVFVINTNIDDMSPEISGHVMNTLLEQGALDVCLVPVHMKKNRPGMQMEIICREKDREKIVETVLLQTSTIGVRCRPEQRFCLKRETVMIDTRYGQVRVKKVTRPDGTLNHIPEYEAAREIALEKGVTLKDVYNHIISDADILDRG